MYFFFFFVLFYNNDLSNKQPKGSYAASSHTHDDRYYTEGEVNNIVNNRIIYRYFETTINSSNYPYLWELNISVSGYKAIMFSINHGSSAEAILNAEVFTDTRIKGYSNKNNVNLRIFVMYIKN